MSGCTLSRLSRHLSGGARCSVNSRMASNRRAVSMSCRSQCNVKCNHDVVRQPAPSLRLASLIGIRIAARYAHLVSF